MTSYKNWLVRWLCICEKSIANYAPRNFMKTLRKGVSCQKPLTLIDVQEGCIRFFPALLIVSYVWGQIQLYAPDQIIMRGLNNARMPKNVQAPRKDWGVDGIHLALRIGGCRFRSRKEAGPLSQREHRGSNKVALGEQRRRLCIAEKPKLAASSRQ